MGNITINDETAATSMAANDLTLFWDVANGYQRKITKANLMGGVLTGGGTIATGGFTLTVPATGTASLLGVAQAYSALKTFGAGLTFGQDTLSYYDDDGAFTPQIFDATSGGNQATITTALGYFCRIGKFCQLHMFMNGITTTGMTAGNNVIVRNLPFTSRNSANMRAHGSCNLVNTSYSSGAHLTPMILPNVAYLDIRKSTSGGGASALIVSELTSGTAQIHISINYLVA